MEGEEGGKSPQAKGKVERENMVKDREKEMSGIGKGKGKKKR